jgi:hypothetical protein
MNKMTVKISFPAITISKKNILGVVFNEEELTTCTAKALKNGFFDKLKILDSTGKCYLVEKAYKKSLKKISIFLDIYLFVNLEFNEKIETLTIDKIKTFVKKIISKNRSFWSSSGNISEIYQKIESAPNAESIMGLLK